MQQFSWRWSASTTWQDAHRSSWDKLGFWLSFIDWAKFETSLSKAKHGISLAEMAEIITLAPFKPVFSTNNRLAMQTNMLRRQQGACSAKQYVWPVNVYHGSRLQFSYFESSWQQLYKAASFIAYRQRHNFLLTHLRKQRFQKQQKNKRRNGSQTAIQISKGDAWNQAFGLPSLISV